MKHIESLLNAKHYLPNGELWTGAVHKMKDKFMTGEKHTISSIELVTMPTVTNLPVDGDPATAELFDNVFTDLQSSAFANEININKLNGAIRGLTNLININKVSIEATVEQLTDAVNNNTTRIENDGVGIIEDVLIDEVITLTPTNAVTFNQYIDSVVFESTTGGTLYLHKGNIETMTESENGLSYIKTGSIPLDIVSRIPGINILDTLDFLDTELEEDIPMADFRYIDSSADEGFSGALRINLSQPSIMSHVKFLYGSYVQGLTIMVNDDSVILTKDSPNLFSMPKQSVYNVSLYFSFIAPSPFHSSITFEEDGSIYDMLKSVFTDVVPNVPEEEEEGGAA